MAGRGIAARHATPRAWRASRSGLKACGDAPRAVAPRRGAQSSARIVRPTTDARDLPSGNTLFSIVACHNIQLARLFRVAWGSQIWGRHVSYRHILTLESPKNKFTVVIMGAPSLAATA